MKKLYTSLALLMIFCFKTYCTTIYWTGEVDNQFNLAQNWSPQIIPQENDRVIIENYSDTIELNSNIFIDELEVRNSVVNLNTYQFTLISQIELNEAHLFNGTIQTGTGKTYIEYSNIDCKTILYSDLFDSHNNTFRKPIILHYQGNNNENEFGSNVYLDTLIVINESSNRFRLAFQNSNKYYGPVELYNLGIGRIEISHEGENEFHNKIELKSTLGEGIRFGTSGGTSILLNESYIICDSLNFTSGHLQLKNISQQSNNFNIIQCGQNVKTTFENCDFSGNVVSYSGGLYLKNNLFQKSSFIKTGDSYSYSYGANTFVDSVVFVQKGSGIFRLSNYEGNIYQSSSVFTREINSGSFQIAYSDTSVFSGDLTLNSWNEFSFGLNDGVIFIDKPTFNLFSNYPINFHELSLSDNTDSINISKTVRFVDEDSKFNLNSAILNCFNNEVIFENRNLTGLIHTNQSKIINNAMISFKQPNQPCSYLIPFERTISIDIGESIEQSISIYQTINNIDYPEISEYGFDFDNENSSNIWGVNADTNFHYSFGISRINNSELFDIYTLNQNGNFWENDNSQQNQDLSFKYIQNLNYPTNFRIGPTESILPIEIIEFSQTCLQNSNNLINILAGDAMINNRIELKGITDDNSSDLLYSNNANLENNFLHLELDVANQYKYFQLTELNTDNEIVFNLFKPNECYENQYNLTIENNKLSFSNTTKLTLIIHDLNGKEVYKQNNTRQIVDINNYSPGIYFISIFNSSNNLVNTEKFYVH